MGSGSNMSLNDAQNIVGSKSKPATNRAPSEKPPFSVSDLRKAIPPHCFQHSLVRSLSYLAFDLSLAALFLWTALFLEHHPLLISLQPSSGWFLWGLYCVLQGCICTGLWVIAHECGHGAFANQNWINDTIGFLLHSALLVPYFSWKYSHRRHHSNTGSITKDEVFVPKKADQLRPYMEFLQHPLARLGHIAVTLTIGWPLYLTLNATGRKYDKMVNHFDPGSLIFNDRERLWVVVSDVGLLSVLGGLAVLASKFGFVWLAKVYFAPLMIVNMFLVLITLLQHTHPSLPHYDEGEWDWLRGALSTIDRSYGFLNHVFHHIADTHVAHHIFSSMPHYHAEEATRALKPILGSYYQFDSTPIVSALWREIRECVYVAPDPQGKSWVLWYKKKVVEQ